MVPTVEFPPLTMFTCQSICVLEEPVTLPLNCAVRPTGTLTFSGEIPTAIPPLLEDPYLLQPAGPIAAAAEIRNRRAARLMSGLPSLLAAWPHRAHLPTAPGC